MANGMSGLYVATSGIQAAQSALNTTAHNLSNINTPGYTRQQISYSASTYMNVGTISTQKLQYGLGVDVSTIRRIRDDLIDAAYRKENGRLGYYESQYDAVSEIESLMGEMQGVTFQSTMTNLWNSLNELSKNPTSTVARESLIETSTVFIDRATSIYNGLKDYQSTLNTKVSNTVDTINELGNKIAKLNYRISYIEATGESANDLRDQRDKAIDELSAYVKTTTSEEKNGMVTVTVEGVDFVSFKTCYEMGTKVIDGTDLYTPTWTHLGDKKVYQDKETVSAIDNNDVGELKGLLIARGNLTVNYTDVPVRPEAADYDNPQDYQNALDEYDKKAAFYNDYIEPSIIISTMASLDKLVNGIVTSINDKLCPEVEKTFTLGGVEMTANVLDMSKTSYGIDTDKSVGVELFSRKNTDRYKLVTADDGTEYYVRNDLNKTNNKSEYTLGNIVLNTKVTSDVATLPLTKADGAEDFDKVKDMLSDWEGEFAALNPSKYAKENFSSFYNSLITEIADKGKVFNTMVKNQQIMSDEYDGQRLQTEGVSSDEELQNMIKFQQAYNASSRYMNTVNEMLEHLIAKLGG